MPGQKSDEAIALNNVQLRYRSHGYQQHMGAIERVVFAFAGQARKTKADAFSFLESIADMPHIKSVGIIMKGNEQCNNNWIRQYLLDQSVFKVLKILF
jgi:hypothetical protein